MAPLVNLLAGKYYIGTKPIPAEVIHRNSRFLRIREVQKLPQFGVDPMLFECTNLVALSVFVGVDENCSEGRLEQVLGTVSRTLRVLKVGRNYGLRPDLLKKDNGGLVLDQLESLKWTCDEPADGYLCELVKWCPYLQSLKLRVKHDEWDFSRLADCLRTSCPKFDTLKLHTTRATRHMETLIRDGSTPGFRNLHLTFEGNTDKVMTVILGHAATLQDLHISPSRDVGDGAFYIRLLVECKRLKSLRYFPQGAEYDYGFFQLLTQQRWGCRGLQEIVIVANSFVQYDKHTAAERQELRALLQEMSWVAVDEDDGEVEEPIRIIHLRAYTRGDRCSSARGDPNVVVGLFLFRRVSSF
ncbi:hypothetical protein BGZ96_007637 [Linnemannia gamsii]|uniref:FBD domain-containing protein n=1 Tax=Linnemannia gamsii TaxID=64522 RepID=A0ABQ7KJE0_9FUNG|nr:hypothetical protein BGZ96_007637 [Linnemannia gamsii]